MSRYLYVTGGAERRAEEMRRDALQCERRGYVTIAEVLWHEAALLSPLRPAPLVQGTRERGAARAVASGPAGNSGNRRRRGAPDPNGVDRAVAHC